MLEQPHASETQQAALQWKRLKRLNLVGARFEYLTHVSLIDRILAKVFLPLLPPAVTPNAITVFRFVAVPVIAFLLITDFPVWGTILFVLAAFSDALDGSLARTTHQITKWGIVADPLADKLLIGTVAVIAISKYLGLGITALIIGIELVLVISAYIRYSGKLTPAKTVGKLKMVLQSVGIGFVLLYGIVPNPLFLLIGQYILYLAIVFGFASLFVYRSI
ncbi:MAG: CDP-alcohol phosphatidyltransferase family protein [bacterium]|nr:CDP-alcohol phosphatidyltransferase family protein [bacterium]